MNTLVAIGIDFATLVMGRKLLIRSNLAAYTQKSSIVDTVA